MTDIESVLNGLIKLGGTALIVVGISSTTGFLFDYNFVSQLPPLLEGFTYTGSAVGIIDSGLWYLTGKNLTS